MAPRDKDLSTPVCHFPESNYQGSPSPGPRQAETNKLLRRNQQRGGRCCSTLGPRERRAVGHSPAVPPGARPSPVAACHTETRVPTWGPDHTPQTRPTSPAKGPTSQPLAQNLRYRTLPLLPATLPQLPAKLWHYQNSPNLEVRKLCADPALPLSSCVTLSRSAASLSFSPFICFSLN